MIAQNVYIRVGVCVILILPYMVEVEYVGDKKIIKR